MDFFHRYFVVLALLVTNVLVFEDVQDVMLKLRVLHFLDKTLVASERLASLLPLLHGLYRVDDLLLSWRDVCHGS